MKLFNRMKNKIIVTFNNSLIYRKLLLISIVTVIMPLILILVFAFYQAFNFRIAEIKSDFMLISTQIANYMENKINNVSSVATNLATNSDIQMFLLEPFNLTSESLNFYKDKVYKPILNAEVNNYSIIDSITIYTNNYEATELGDKILPDTYLESLPEFENIKDINNQISFIYSHGQNNNEIISYIQQIRTITNIYLGFIKIDMNVNSLINLESIKPYNIPYLLTYKGDVLYTSEDAFEQVINNNYSQDCILKHNKLYIRQNISKIGLDAMFCFDIQESISRSLIPNILIVFLTILGTALVLIFYLILLKNIVSKFNSLIFSLKTIIEQQKFDERIPVDSNDEIGQITTEINHLIAYIKKKIDETIIKETAQKDARYLALQYQINPHFIYNTLDFFRFQLEIEGNEQVADAIAKFGKMLRYNISSTYKESTIALEIENVVNYIDLQNFKNKNRIILNYNVPDELKGTKIIKFSLQPIIENSIKYGLKDNNSSLNINIDVTRNSNDVIISVTDNGAGINPIHLRRLNSYFNKSKYDYVDIHTENKIGLRNINERLKLLYGEKYCIKLESEYGQYTKTVLKIPLCDGDII